MILGSSGRGGGTPDAGWVVDLGKQGVEVSTNDLFLLPDWKRPTAVFCWSDYAARILIGNVQRRGLSVPDRLSVMGFDDRSDLVSLCYPEITTMRQPFYELGRCAGEMLFARLAGEKRVRKALVNPELIIRQSCREWR